MMVIAAARRFGLSAALGLSFSNCRASPCFSFYINGLRCFMRLAAGEPSGFCRLQATAETAMRKKGSHINGLGLSLFGDRLSRP
ncbi:hypothetical protein [Chromobacterium violaceum]|uniref:hypothetical protein n=1 Tax=Chromobacterium violaceum TaxID=536 RepID=UPI0011C04A69|nr:hypothetical protein [Chromobacterium violaceum]